MNRSSSRQALLIALLVTAASLVVSAGQQQELPRFRSSVELTSMDVSVLDDRGRPITDLKPEEFRVRVDGAPRRVISATWIPLEAPPGPPAPAAPDGYSSNDSATGGRLILLVIDQPNIRFGGTMGIRKAVYSFIDRLQPSDRAAVVGIGPGSPSTPFTADRDRLKKAVEGMVGQHQESGLFLHSIAMSEALDIQRQVPGVLDKVFNRECLQDPRGGGAFISADVDMCVFEIEQQANEMARSATADGQDTISTIRRLLNALKAIDAPKTMILVSEGFIIEDHTSSVVELGSIAAAARTSIYALKLDDELFAVSASERSAPIATMNDRVARSQGLDELVGASRGALFNVIASGAGIFERIASELSGYYLLGVESGATDKDGKAHPIRVDVNRSAVTVRSRRALLAPTEVRQPRNAREAVVAALQTPLPLSALPLRVATYSLQGPETEKVQILIHADVGTDYSSSRVTSLGYMISDSAGHLVDSHLGNARLQPMMNGVPSALQFAGGASLPPGEYSMKLAVAEGDRVGTVEHTIHAGVLPAAAALRVSDLMVGGPASTGEELLQPTVGYSVVFGVVHGYIEAYGSGVEALRAKYEIAADEKAPALLDVDVTPRLAGDARAIFTRVMPVRQLPPGKYVLRATLSSGADTVKVESRSFEVSTPAVLMTSASSSGLATLSEVYLPVSEAVLSRGFNPNELSRKETVASFRAHVPESALPAFDKGVQFLSNGAYADAEATFKSAIDPDTDSSALIAYLAAVFAAAGNDTEAAGAWQTALIDGAENPQVYDWLVGSLIRNRDLATARSMLEEANSKWPSDTRFARPMALVYATLGQGVQAVRSLERHLAVHKDDIEALFMGVEWIYQLRAAGLSAATPADDLKQAKSYADAYSKAKGPQSALVKQWIGFLESKK
jgi:VWFA-related protein